MAKRRIRGLSGCKRDTKSNRVFRGNRNGTLWLLALTTGLRRGELLGLRWKDVELERGVLYTFTTHALAHGANIKVVSEAICHADGGTTPRTYAHVLPEQRRYSGSELWSDTCACAEEVIRLLADRVQARVDEIEQARESA